jgi:hypothetical protein
MLEAIKENWLNEVGGADGNDGAEKEGLWERAMDVKPLMTEEDKAKLAEAKQVRRRQRVERSELSYFALYDH